VVNGSINLHVVNRKCIRYNDIILRAVIKCLGRRNIEDVTRNIVEHGQRPFNEGPEGQSF